MAKWRVCRGSHVCTLALPILLLPASALAQQPGVSLTNAPSFTDRNSSFTLTVTSTAAPSSTATFSLSASFPDVTLSESAWSLTCAAVSCSSTRTVTVTTAHTGGRTLQIRAIGRNGALTATALANIWVRGAADFTPATLTLQPQETQSIGIVLQTTPPLGVTFQLVPGGPAATGSVVPATVSVNPGTTSVSFSITAGTSGGTLTISATTSSVYYTAPAPFVAQILSPAEAPTPAGTNITVTPPVPLGGAVPVRVTFSEVTAAGQTTLTNVAAPAAPPSGYGTPGSPLDFDLSTTATTSGTVTVCATYPDGAAVDETGLRLFVLTPDGWSDTTVSLDATANLICGSVDSLSGGATFGIFGLNSPPDVGPITGPVSTVASGTTQAFSATFTDPDATDTHTGVWMWGDGTMSPAVITNENGTLTAAGEHAFPAGTHQVRLVINDGGQSAASDDFEVVVDGSAPVIAAISASPATLWPPDGRMKDVLLNVSATDDTGTPACTITGVTADAKHVEQAAFTVTGPRAVQLKASPHTAYTIEVTCSDAIGRTVTGHTRVTVSK